MKLAGPVTVVTDDAMDSVARALSMYLPSIRFERYVLPTCLLYLRLVLAQKFNQTEALCM